MSVKSFFNRLKFWKRDIADQEFKSENSPEYRLANKLKRYEKYVFQMQEIISWDNPVYSMLCVIIINILFWIFVSLEWRFYGIISSVLLAVTVHDAWTGLVWPEISVRGSVVSSPDSHPTPMHPSVVAVSKVLTSFSTIFNQYFIWMRNLRNQQPGLFCCMCSLASSVLLMVGRSVSGLVVAYLLLMAVLLVPGAYRNFVPPEFKQTMAQHFACVHQAYAKYLPNEASDDEYMPVTTSEDLALLTRASDLHHGTYDSITNPESSSEMISGLMMPSHEEDSLTGFSDLEPFINSALEHNDDSDSNHEHFDHQIEFQSGHFNGDSSSDEDVGAFARDLQFTEADEQDASAALSRGISSLITQAVTSNVLGSVGLLANVLRSRQTEASHARQPTPATRPADSDSDDNDDFEFINPDELNNQKT